MKNVVKSTFDFRLDRMALLPFQFRNKVSDGKGPVAQADDMGRLRVCGYLFHADHFLPGKYIQGEALGIRKIKRGAVKLLLLERN